jgi:hypothetical protein
MTTADHQGPLVLGGTKTNTASIKFSISECHFLIPD